jgi:putative aldouronate transport system permease protein
MNSLSQTEGEIRAGYSARKMSYLGTVAKRLKRDRWMYFLLLPGLLYFIIFKYLPMGGLIMVFQNYKPYTGFLHSRWVGLDNFERFFSEPVFWQLLWNTLILAFYNIIFYFPLPIILALMLNEIMSSAFKRVAQTLLYIPHFVSWVIIVGITYIMLSTDGGIINELYKSQTGQPFQALTDPDWFRPLIILQTIWKDIGWGTIIFLAALAGVDMQLYEAARMDGASRFRQLWHITLPAIRSTIVILLILRMGHFLDTGFEHIFLMLNSLNRGVGDVFETYVYTKGLVQAQYSYSAAVGVFKSIVGLILVLGSNWLAKKFGEEGIY